MLRHCVAIVLVLGPAAAFTPTTLRAPLGVSTIRRPQPSSVLPSRRLPMDGSSVVMAAASTPQTLAPTLAARALMRFTLALAASLLAIFARVGSAFAVDRSVRTAAPPLAFAIAGIPFKWVVVIAGLGGLYCFRREETPILTLTETVIPEDEQVNRPPAADLTEVDGLAPPGSSDDASLNSALLMRMQAIAAEHAKAEEQGPSGDAATPPSNDSTDSWGTGSTAVLEPPGSSSPPPTPEGGLLEGESAVDFPVGFPLVEGDFQTEPAASDDQIAMLQRMMGAGGEK